MGLSNKVILVTGGTTSIGQAIVKKSLEQGAKVMLHGHDYAREAELFCSSYPESQVAYSISDLNAKNAERLVEQTIQTFGKMDALVNCAAHQQEDAIREFDVDRFDQTLSINVKMPLLLSKLLANYLISEKRPGTILNIGSINAYCGHTCLLSYSVSKGALMVATRNMADALSKYRIRVNQLNVGATKSTRVDRVMRAHFKTASWEKYLPQQQAPLNRLLDPEEVANHAIFWLSDQSAPITGAVYECEQYPFIGRQYELEST